MKCILILHVNNRKLGYYYCDKGEEVHAKYPITVNNDTSHCRCIYSD